MALRGDAAFARPELYEGPKEREVKYAIRLPANDNLERNIAEFQGVADAANGKAQLQTGSSVQEFLYEAASWETARLVVEKVEFHFGELFPRVGFIVTNLAVLSRAVVRFYNKRGTAEMDKGRQ